MIDLSIDPIQFSAIEANYATYLKVNDYVAGGKVSRA
jgi:hypothetical protein